MSDTAGSDHHQPPLMCRGVRGATTAVANTPDAILTATRELLGAILDANQIDPLEVASIFFTTTPDLNATYPALAARQLGLTETALLGAQEIALPGGIPRCVRILVHWNTNRRPAEITHIYLNEARQLRPDLLDNSDLAPFRPI